MDATQEVINAIMGRVMGLAQLIVDKGIATENECAKAILDGERKIGYGVQMIQELYQKHCEFQRAMGLGTVMTVDEFPGWLASQTPEVREGLIRDWKRGYAATLAAENEAAREEVEGREVAMQFQWEGDMDDDCSLRVGGLLAHAECMGDTIIKGEDGEPDWNTEDWYCCVSRGDEQLFHSGEPGGSILGGDMARKICEAIIRAALNLPQTQF